MRITGADGLKNKVDTKTYKSAALGYRFDDKNNFSFAQKIVDKIQNLAYYIS